MPTALAAGEESFLADVSPARGEFVGAGDVARSTGRQRGVDAGQLDARFEPATCAAAAAAFLRQQEPLFYRGDAAKAVFAGGFSVQPRAVAVDVQSQARLDAHAATVEQRLVYTIRYEPIERLELEVPRVLAGADGFSIRWQDQWLTPVVAPGSENPGPAAATVRMWGCFPRLPSATAI